MTALRISASRRGDATDRLGIGSQRGLSTKSRTIADCIRKLDVAFAFLDESDWLARRLLHACIAELHMLTGV